MTTKEFREWMHRYFALHDDDHFVWYYTKKIGALLFTFMGVVSIVALMLLLLAYGCCDVMKPLRKSEYMKEKDR